MFEQNQNPMNGMMPKKVTPQMFGVVLLVALAVIMTLMGDRAAFVERPANPFTWLCGTVVGAIYLVTKNRLLAGFGGFCIFGTLFMVIGLIGWQFIERKIVEPMMLKRMVDTKKRQQEYLNKIGDDSI